MPSVDSMQTELACLLLAWEYTKCPTCIMWCWIVLWKTWLLMFPNWEALINCPPSAEAKRACKHLPTIQLSDPRPSGSQPTLCCKKSLLTPSIKATLIFCLKQPTTWTAFMVLITLSPARRRWPQRAKKLYQVSPSVSYHTFILHQGLVTLFGLSALARTYHVQRTRAGRWGIRNQGQWQQLHI